MMLAVTTGVGGVNILDSVGDELDYRRAIEEIGWGRIPMRQVRCHARWLRSLLRRTYAHTHITLTT